MDLQPQRYRSATDSVEYRLYDFKKWYRPESRVLSPAPCTGQGLLNKFAVTVSASIGGKYLPAVRLSDGDSKRCSDRRRPWYASDRMVCVHPLRNASRH